MSQEFMSGKRICGRVWHGRHDRRYCTKQSAVKSPKGQTAFASQQSQTWIEAEMRMKERVKEKVEMAPLVIQLRAAWKHLSKILLSTVQRHERYKILMLLVSHIIVYHGVLFSIEKSSPCWSLWDPSRSRGALVEGWIFWVRVWRMVVWHIRPLQDTWVYVTLLINNQCLLYFFLTAATIFCKLTAIIATHRKKLLLKRWHWTLKVSCLWT